MIVDKICNISQYKQFEKYEEVILAFIKKCDKEDLEAGKYGLDDENLFALVQKYSKKQKNESRMESHKKYADLQYIVNGTEVIYYDCVDELIVEDDRSKESDIIFYEKKEDKGGNILGAGMFGYYAPQDAHMPCIQSGEVGDEVVKIVFKIKMNFF